MPASTGPNYKNPIPLTSRDFATIKSALQTYVQAQHPELWSDFFESNIGVMLMGMISYVGDLLSFANNRLSEEAFIATCRNYGSILRHTKMLGYVPYANSAASVTLRINPRPEGDITIPAGSAVVSGSLRFETLSSYSFASTDASPLDISAAHGTTVTDSWVAPDPTTDANQGKFQRYTSSQNPVIQGSWRVIVDGVEWSEVEFVEVEPADTQSYSYEVNADQSITVRFGNDLNGKIPPSGSEIKLVYRVGGGAAGNVPANAIRGSIAGTVTLNGVTTPTTLYVFNPNAASGGSDRETLEHIRTWAPAQVRTVDKAITREDYETLAASFTDAAEGTVARARAKLRQGTLLIRQTGGGTPGAPVTVPPLTPVSLGSFGTYLTYTEMLLNGGNPNIVIDPNTVDVYILAPTTENVSGVLRPTFGPASQGLKLSLLTHLLSRSVVTTLPVIRDAVTLSVNVALGTIHIDRTYELGGVQIAIRDAIDGFFTRDGFNIGDPFRLSELYDWVTNVPGVLDFVDQDPAGDVFSDDVTMLVRGTVTFEAVYPPLSSAVDMTGRY